MWKKRAGIAALGALLFCLPNVLCSLIWHRLLVEVVPGHWLRLVLASVVPTVAVLAGYLWLRSRHCEGPIVGWLLFGLWFVLPCVEVVLFSFGEGAGPELLFMILIAPLTMWILSAYDGTLFALLLTSVMLLAIFIFADRDLLQRRQEAALPQPHSGE